MPYLLAVSLLSASLLLHAQSASPLQLAGRVVHHASDRPVKGARVSISLTDHPDRQISVLSGENGEFSFSGLAAGKYSLAVNDHGWFQHFQQLDTYWTGIVVAPSLDSQHIVFELESPARLSGSVLDDGDPVSNARVYLFGRFLSEGAYRTQLQESANTSTDGSFHFSHLAPGTYYVAISGEPWYASRLPPGMQLLQPPPAPTPDTDVTYPLTYYASATTPEGATPLQLAAGVRAQIQINLHAVPALHITLDGVEKQPDQQLAPFLRATGPGGTLITLPAVGNGSELSGVAPGNYVLSASLSGPNPIPIGSQAVSFTADTTVHLGDAVKTSVGGKIILDSGTPPQLAVLLSNLTNSNNAFGLVAQDGSFAMNDVLPGRYNLRLANTPDFYIRAVKVKGGIYASGVLDVSPGAQIELTIAAGSGYAKVAGVAVQGKEPVAGAMVLLIPQDVSRSNYIPRDQSDSDGTFILPWAAPGGYTLIAIDNGRDLEYANPTVIAPYLKNGRVLDVPTPPNTPVEIAVQPRK